MHFVVLPQIEASHDPGQGAVGNTMAVLILQNLLNPDHIALSDFEYLREAGRNLLVGGFPERSLLPLPPDHTSDCVSGDLKDLADLPDLHSSLMKV